MNETGGGHLVVTRPRAAVPPLTLGWFWVVVSLNWKQPPPAHTHTPGTRVPGYGRGSRGFASAPGSD